MVHRGSEEVARVRRGAGPLTSVITASTDPTVNKRVQILHLATAHSARDPRIFEKECASLVAAGYDVGYVVPNSADETIEGVRILAVPVPSSGGERLSKTTRHVIRRALLESRGAAQTVFHVHEAELLPLSLGLAARGRTVVYDAHENTPSQMHHQAWIPKPLRRPAGWTYAALEAAAGRAFAGVIAAVPAIADRYPSAKTALIRNFPVLTIGSGPILRDRAPIVAYVGAVTEARGAVEMVRAIGLMDRTSGATLEIGGTVYPAALQETLGELRGIDRTTMLGQLGRDEVGALLDRARVGLAVLHDTPQYREAYPTKLFEYMAAGVPAVVSDFPLWRQMVEGAGCGIVVDPTSPTAIADACELLLADTQLAERLGAAGREAARTTYNWEPEGARLLAFYDAIVRRDRAPGAYAHGVVPS